MAIIASFRTPRQGPLPAWEHDDWVAGAGEGVYGTIATMGALISDGGLFASPGLGVALGATKTGDQGREWRRHQERTLAKRGECGVSRDRGCSAWR